MILHHAGLIVPSLQGGDFVRNMLSLFLDYEKLKAEGYRGEYSSFVAYTSYRLGMKAGGWKVCRASQNPQRLHTTNLSKWTMPDRNPVKMVDQLTAPCLLYHKF